MRLDSYDPFCYKIYEIICPLFLAFTFQERNCHCDSAIGMYQKWPLIALGFVDENTIRRIIQVSFAHFFNIFFKKLTYPNGVAYKIIAQQDITVWWAG